LGMPAFVCQRSSNVMGLGLADMPKYGGAMATPGSYRPVSTYFPT